MPQPPSNLATSRCNDDSWFAAHESRQPLPHPPVADDRQFNSYVAEYNAKYEVYHRLHQEMSAVHRQVTISTPLESFRLIRATVAWCSCCAVLHRCYCIARKVCALLLPA